MSDDGADLGVSADVALSAVMGGEQPKSEDKRDPVQMEAYLRGTPDTIGGYGEGGSGYEDSARLLGKYVLEFMLRHNESAQLPAEPEFDREHPAYQKWIAGDGSYDAVKDAVKVEGFGEYWQRVEPDNYREAMDKIQPSGFQFGWALNAARYCCELPSVPNPAIVTIGGSE